MPTLAPAPRHLHRSHALHHDAQSAALAIADGERRIELEVAHTAKISSRLHALGRILLAALFLTSAVAKLWDFTATRHAMDAFGLSGSGGLLLLAIAAELTGGLMVAIGWHTRRAAFGLIAYVTLTSLFFHHDLTVDLNRVFALTNLAIVGGLVLLTAHGSGGHSLRRWLEARAAARSGNAS